MERLAVTSSVVAEVGYGRSQRTLEIMFKSGAIYFYHFVPEALYEGLMGADSKGAYFNAHIKGKFGELRIAEPYDVPSKKPGKPGGGRRRPPKRG